MMFERMIGNNIFRKVRQIELLCRNNTLLANSCKFPQTGRTSTSLANVNRCLNSNITNNEKAYSLLKFPSNKGVNMQLNRTLASTQGDHVRLWVLERIVAAALPILLPAAFLMENVILDAVISVLVVMHTHWGLEAIIVDYARPIVVGPVLPKILHVTLFALSAVTLAGLFILIHDGPGVTKAIKNAWELGKKKPSPPIAD